MTIERSSQRISELFARGVIVSSKDFQIENLSDGRQRAHFRGAFSVATTAPPAPPAPPCETDWDSIVGDRITTNRWLPPGDEFDVIGGTSELLFTNLTDIPRPSAPNCVRAACFRLLHFCSNRGWNFRDEGNPKNAGSTQDYIDLAKTYYTPAAGESGFIGFVFYGVRGNVTGWQNWTGYGLTYFSIYHITLDDL